MSETYDNSVAYPSFVFDHIRPDQIGAMAALHDMTQDDVEHCRVLELGCGDGANLLSIAYTMPDSTCVGIDLSEQRINEAKATAERLGTTNALFREMNVMDVSPEEFGEFDFIIAHGLYSWVTAPVREHILSIYSSSLKPGGVGYISYNAYPGWHMRNAIRDAMRFQSEDIADPIEKLESSLNFVEFLCEAAKPESVYRSFLEIERKSFSARYKASLLHDDLADVNQPFYFRDFIETISKHGLKFISESEPVAFFYNTLPTSARELLEQLWDEPIRREQYLDFIRCSSFRSTLICHDSAKPCYRPNADGVEPLFLSTRSDPKSEDPVFTDDSEVMFTAPRDTEFSTNHAFTKTALHILGSSRPSFLTFNELAQRVGDSFAELDKPALTAETDQLKVYILELIHSSIVEAKCFLPRFAKEVSDLPRMSEFARWQAETGFSYTTSMTGASRAIANDLIRAMIVLLDGSRDRNLLIKDLLEQVSVGPNERESFVAALPNMVDSNLQTFVESSLIVG